MTTCYLCGETHHDDAVACPDCHPESACDVCGRGTDHDGACVVGHCPHCDGSGVDPDPNKGFFGFSLPCGCCNGTGHRCTVCGGGSWHAGPCTECEAKS